MGSIRKQPTLRDANISLRIKWLMRSACRDSIPRTYHYPDLGSAFDWSYGAGNLLQPIRSRTQIWALSSRSDAGKPVLASWAVFSDHLWKRRSCFIIINSPFTWNILDIGGVVASTGFPAKWDLIEEQTQKFRFKVTSFHCEIIPSLIVPFYSQTIPQFQCKTRYEARLFFGLLAHRTRHTQK